MKSATLFTLSVVNAQTYENQNYLPVYQSLSVCTDTNYHTDCAWNECCGYLEACCTRATNADTCDYSDVSTKEEIANKWPECRDPYSLDANVPGRTGKYYLLNVEPNPIPGVTQDY